MKRDIQIRFESGQYRGATIPVTQDGEFVLGRDAERCQLVFSDSHISRRHCTIYYDSRTDRVILRNESQTSGVYVEHQNGAGGTQYSSGARKLSAPGEEASLESGDRIRIGKGEEVFTVIYTEAQSASQMYSSAPYISPQSGKSPSSGTNVGAVVGILIAACVLLVGMVALLVTSSGTKTDISGSGSVEDNTTDVSDSGISGDDTTSTSDSDAAGDDTSSANNSGASGEKITSPDVAQQYLIKNGGQSADIGYDVSDGRNYYNHVYYQANLTYNGVKIYGKKATVACASDGTVRDTFSPDQINISSAASEALTNTQTEQAARKFMENTYACDADEIQCSEVEKVYFIQDGTAIPAYSYNLAGKTGSGEPVGRLMLISCADGSLLSDTSTISYAQETGEYQGQKTTQNITYENADNVCTMSNTEDGITVSVANDPDDVTYFMKGHYSLVTWAKGANEPNPSAVDAMATMMEIVDFYENSEAGNFKGLTGLDTVCASPSNPIPLECYVNVTTMLTSKGKYSKYEDVVDNAYAWQAPNGHTIIAFTVRTDGQAEFSSELDAASHEFGHTIFRYIVQPTAAMDIRALNEGYSDVLALCNESYCYNRAIDWKIGNDSIIRDIANAPKVTSYEEYKKLSDDYDQHYRSMLMTHAVYLMAQGYERDGYTREDTRIDTVEQLMNLLGSTLQVLPSDADYIMWRAVVERTADMLYEDRDITEAQRQCITYALDEVGIPVGDENTDNKLDESIAQKEEEKQREEQEQREQEQREQAQTNEREMYNTYVKDVLIPKYGVMTIGIKKQDYYSMDSSSWIGEDEIKGLLHVSIEDYGQDGTPELLVIRGETNAGRDSTDDDGVVLYMEMYEYNGTEVQRTACEEIDPIYSFRNRDYLVQEGFFAYEYGGQTYIVVDSYGMNGYSTTMLSFYKYENQQFVYVKGLYATTDNDVYSIYEANERPGSGSSNGWNEIYRYSTAETEIDNEYDVIDSWNNGLKGFKQTYADKLSEMGLTADDTRMVIPDTISGGIPESLSDAISSIGSYTGTSYIFNTTTKDIYQANEGELDNLAYIATYMYVDLSEMTCYLERMDIGNSLDGYR